MMSANHMRRLLLIFALSQVILSQTAAPVSSPRTAQDAIERALPLLQSSASEFVSKRACFSCHHNALPILMLHSAQRHGFTIDKTVLSTVEDKTFRELRAPDALDRTIQVATLDDPTPNDSMLLMAAAAAGMERNLTLAVRTQQLMGWQQEDGHWATSDFRPPHSSSMFTATATAVRAISLYAPVTIVERAHLALKSAQQWLRKTRPVSTEDAAFRLMGLAWAPTLPNVGGDVVTARHDLLSMQRSDGGWPQLDGYESDAYSTGEALFALTQSHVKPTDGAFQKGVAFLASTQAADGTWHVHTRMLSPADVSPPYFSTGFPYGKDEFISYAGTSWAVMGLLGAFPDFPLLPLDTEQDRWPRWISTALLGTANDLKQLLESGLSANSKTENGTTLLMMAATDVEKVQLLIGKGADVKARTAAGVDALTIASAYRGTATSLRVLLDAGASPQPTGGVHVRRSPLEFAAMTGDAANVALLLSRGADAETGALSEAITFGHDKIVQLLIHAGADTELTDSSGVNLLHWATITNRSAVIPLLVKAKVPLDEADKAGYTPLMYAATIDFGDTRTLTALLRAGASTQSKNLEGRNAIEQARYFKHTAIETALTKR